MRSMRLLSRADRAARRLGLASAPRFLTETGDRSKQAGWKAEDREPCGRGLEKVHEFHYTHTPHNKTEQRLSMLSVYACVCKNGGWGA